MILVLDVTGNPGKVVLGQTEQLTQVDLGEKRHSENLLPELQRLSHQFGRPQQLGVITGPGSFTGIRIGIATAMGLSTGWQIPLYAIDHFSLMAPLAPEDATLAVPAGRNRFYCKQGAQTQLVEGLELGPNVFGAHPALNSLSTDPLFHFLTLIETQKIEPTRFVQGYYAKPPDAVRGTSLLEKLLQR